MGNIILFHELDKFLRCCVASLFIFVLKIEFNRQYVGKADFLVFRTLNQHGFLGQLQEKKLVSNNVLVTACSSLNLIEICSKWLTACSSLIEINCKWLTSFLG